MIAGWKEPPQTDYPFYDTSVGLGSHSDKKDLALMKEIGSGILTADALYLNIIGDRSRKAINNKIENIDRSSLMKQSGALVIQRPPSLEEQRQMGLMLALRLGDSFQPIRDAFLFKKRTGLSIGLALGFAFALLVSLFEITVISLGLPLWITFAVTAILLVEAIAVYAKYRLADKELRLGRRVDEESD